MNDMQYARQFEASSTLDGEIVFALPTVSNYTFHTKRWRWLFHGKGGPLKIGQTCTGTSYVPLIAPI